MNASMHQRTRGTSSFPCIATYALEQNRCEQSQMVNKINSTLIVPQPLPQLFWWSCKYSQNSYPPKPYDTIFMIDVFSIKTRIWGTTRCSYGCIGTCWNCWKDGEGFVSKVLKPYNVFRWWQHHRHRLDLYHKWASLDPCFFVLVSFFFKVWPPMIA